MLKRNKSVRKALGVVPRKKREEADVATIINDPLHRTKALVQELIDIRRKLKPLKEKEEELNGQVKLWGVGAYPGFTAAIEVSEYESSSMDTKKLKEENPAIAEKYTTKKIVRKSEIIPLVKG